MIPQLIREHRLPDLLFMVPILVLTLVGHELCHGWIAYALGDTTAKEQGRLSINPLKHVDPIGFVLMLVMGFGWAKPVRVDLRNFQKPKRDFALTAIGGPLFNFLLSFVLVLVYTFWFLLKAESYQGQLYADLQPVWVVNALTYAIVINISLGVFNMIPIPPLDGSRVIGALLPDKLYILYLRLEKYGMMILFAIIALGGLSGVLSTGTNTIFDWYLSAALFICKPLVRVLGG
jgi:Zn-dependent protease